MDCRELLGRDPCVDRRNPHYRTPLCAPSDGPLPSGHQKYRRPGRAWTRAGDQTHSRRGLEVGRFLARGSAMLFESSYKRVQRACHDRSHGQATASRVIPQQSHRAKNKVGHQENWGQNARGVEDQTIGRNETGVSIA
jgi:hypothetical protein